MVGKASLCQGGLLPQPLTSYHSTLRRQSGDCARKRAQKGSFPAAAPAAKRRGRRLGRKPWGVCGVALVQNHGRHRDKLGGGLIWPRG